MARESLSKRKRCRRKRRIEFLNRFSNTVTGKLLIFLQIQLVIQKKRFSHQNKV